MSDTVRVRVQFKATPQQRALILKIGARAVKLARDLTGSSVRLTDVMMDIEACISNGCPLDLVELLAADDLNFAHDVFGIHRHINRDTGKLENCFSPRFSERVV